AHYLARPIDIGEERKGAAGDGAVVAFAKARALAFDGAARGGQLLLDLARRRIVGLEDVPQIGARLQQVPLGLFRDRHRVLGRAAYRLAVVQGRAFAAAIEARHRRVEAFIEAGEIGGGQGHGTAFGYYARYGLQLIPARATPRSLSCPGFPVEGKWEYHSAPVGPILAQANSCGRGRPATPSCPMPHSCAARRTPLPPSVS